MNEFKMQMETYISIYGLTGLLDVIAEVCYETAKQLNEDPVKPDINAARIWEARAKMIEAFADQYLPRTKKVES